MVEIAFFVITFFLSVLAEATLGIKLNAPGIGSFVGIAFVGAVLLYEIRHKK